MIGGTPVGVRTTSRAFGVWLDAALGAYAADGWDGADYSLVVDDGAAFRERGRRDFSILYRGTTPILRTLDLPTLGRALLNELSSLLVTERDDVIFLALPVLVGRDTAVLVSPRIAVAVGELGRRAERAGLGLPATTFEAIDPATGRVVPLRPLLVGGRPEERSWSPKWSWLAQDHEGNGAQDRDGGGRDLLETPATSWPILDALGSSRPAAGPRLVTEPVRIDAVCLSDRGAGATPRPRSRVATLATLLASTLNFPSVGAAAVVGLARLVEHARCYELGRADARQTLSALTTILDPGRA